MSKRRQGDMREARQKSTGASTPTERREQARRSTPDFTESLFLPVRLESLALFRMAFGAIMVWEVYRYFAADRIRRFYMEPGFLFSYFGFDWVHPWPGHGMTVHFSLLGVLGFLIMAGLFYRVTITLFFFGFTYV